jgi:hypothetical protein
MKLSDRLDALFWRLYAAAGIFCLAAITVQLEPFLQYMAMCMFFLLAIVPLQAIAALVDFYLDLRADFNPRPS